MAALSQSKPASGHSGWCASAELGRQAFWDLESWLTSAPAQRLGLPSVERETEARGRELLRLQLQAYIDARGDGDEGPALTIRTAADAFPLTYTHKRLRTRQLMTLFGTIRLRRTGYSRRGGVSVHPLDAQLQLPGRKYSYELQRRLVRSALQGPFDEALDTIARSTGNRLSKRSAEQIVIEASHDFESFYAQPQDWTCDLDAPLLIAAIDSKGIPMVKPEPALRRVRQGKGEKKQKKKMSTVAAVFTQLPDPRTAAQIIDRLFAPVHTPPAQHRPSRPRHKRVWASLLAAKDVFIATVREEMLRRDPEHRKTWLIVTDGERGLQYRVCEQFQDFTLILDFLHVLEKLWHAAHALHAEGSAEAETFVRIRADRILRGQVSQVVKGLRQSSTKRRLQGVKQKALEGAAAYFYRNRARMRYDIYLENGWPIASGAVEGACKNLIKDRMERSGMRWTPTMAEAMLRLRALLLSGDFDRYWEYHVAQDQLRLYPYIPATVVAK